MRELQLPAWATVVGPGKVEADADGFYEEWLNLLGLEGKEVTQFDLECAFQCAKLDIQLAVAGTNFVPRGGALVIRVKDTTKAHINNDPEEEYISKWAQCRYPRGKGAEAASKGGEARVLFRKIRNIPSI